MQSPQIPAAADFIGGPVVYLDNVRVQVKDVDVSDVRVRCRKDSGEVAEMRCLYPTSVAPRGGFGLDELRAAKDPVLREEEVSVALRIPAKEGWERKYFGRALRRLGNRTHSYKRGNLSADVILTKFEPKIPEGVFQAESAEAEVA